MNIKLVLFVIIFISGYMFSSLGNTPKNRRNYIILMMVVFTLESCLRGLSVGSDTFNYYCMFNDDGLQSWSEVWNLFLDRYINHSTEFDVGFTVFNKLIYIFTSNFSIYLGICALFFFIPYGKLLYKYTHDFVQLIFIFILYVSLFHMIAMSGVRKEIALGCTVWAMIAYIEKNYKQCVISLILGTFIHMSTLLFLLVPALSFLSQKKLRLLHIVGLLSIPFVIANSGTIIVFMGNFIGMEKYAGYGMKGADGGAMTFTFLIEAISLFCLIAFWNSEFKKRSHMQILYAVLPCFSFFAPLITNNGSMIRISQYFHLYVMLLFPFAIDAFFVKQRIMIYFICCLVLLLLAFNAGGEPYYFIWEDNMLVYQ